jgi:hypothetical protein
MAVVRACTEGLEEEVELRLKRSVVLKMNLFGIFLLSSSREG